MSEIHRRQFLGTCAAAALSAAAVYPSSPAYGAELLATRAAAESDDLFSVMLWTVELKLPFERRVAMVAEAGYHAVELVSEYNGWSAGEFARARQQLHQLSLIHI